MAVYPEYMVAPIRQDLVEAGFEQLMSPQEVDAALAATEGTVLVAVNSVCGCAAGKARPLSSWLWLAPRKSLLSS